MSRKRRYQEPPLPPALPPTAQTDAEYMGMRNIHRDGSGRVIGGYTPEGKGMGTKQRKEVGRREIATPGLDSLAAMQPGYQKPFDPANGTTQAATGDLLQKRLALFASMEKAGANGLNEDMRQQARALQVTDSGFNQAATRIKANASVTQPLTVTGTTPAAGVTVPPAPADLNAAPAYVIPGTAPTVPPAVTPTAAAQPIAATPTAPAPAAPIAGATAAAPRESKMFGASTSKVLELASIRADRARAGQTLTPDPILDSQSPNFRRAAPATTAVLTPPAMAQPAPKALPIGPAQTSALDAQEAIGKPATPVMSPKDKLASAQGDLSSAQAANSYAFENSGMPDKRKRSWQTT